MSSTLTRTPGRPVSAAAKRATAKRQAAKRAASRTKRRPRKKPKKLPVCTKKDLRKKKSRRRKCRVVKVRKKPVRLSPTGPVAAPPVTMPVADAHPMPAGSTAPTAPESVPQPPTSSDTPPPDPAPPPARRETDVYLGVFGVEQATRLLHRAGFGPSPGQAERLAKLGLAGAVDALVNPGPAELKGPAPSGGFLIGGQLQPDLVWGHLHLQWMDRMVRSTDQLGERLALVFHDWFAVTQQAVPYPQVRQHIDLLRRGCTGSFRKLLQDVTVDPAMLAFLNGFDNRKGAPNENYGRELMELFTLGAERGAYDQRDVAEISRAFTGWTYSWDPIRGPHDVRFDTKRFDNGTKTLFAGTAHQRTGNLTGRDAVNAVVDHPLHPSFVVTKLWSYFVPTAPSAATVDSLAGLYRSSGEQILPVVAAILKHPDLYRGPSMVKPPVVYVSGLLRARGMGITSDVWAWGLQAAGQMLGEPPNVAGWNDNAWLNTTTHAMRWLAAHELVRSDQAQPSDYPGGIETPAQAIAAALSFWDNPPISVDHMTALQSVAKQEWSGWADGSRSQFLAVRQNALRQMVVCAPDAQVS